MLDRNTIIDISIPLKEGMPAWPNGKKLKIGKEMDMEKGDRSNDSFLECNVHTGTHIDAPRHFLKNGKTMEQIPLDVLIGPATVAHFPNTDAITAQDLDDLNLSNNIERLLLKTRNAEFWEKDEKKFREDFVALLPDAAQWISDHNIKLVGIDYLSIEPYRNEGFSTHHILLKADVVIVEGLNLASVEPGTYELVCMPLSIPNIEASPARAILQPPPSSNDQF